MNRGPVDATAFAHRDKAFYIAADSSWETDDPEPERHIAWAEAFWRAVAPHTDGAYASFMGDEGEERIRAAYPPATYDRLAAIKRRYDPQNLFRLNPNIPPDRVRGSRVGRRGVDEDADPAGPYCCGFSLYTVSGHNAHLRKWT